MDISATALAPISASTDLDLDEWCGPESRDHVSEFGDRLAEFLPDARRGSQRSRPQTLWPTCGPSTRTS